MNRTDGRKSRPRQKFESQDDFGYLTGRHSHEDKDRQIKTPGHPQDDGHGEDYRRSHPAKGHRD